MSCSPKSRPREMLSILFLLGALYFFTANAADQIPPSPPCSCSSGFIPVPVDVTISVDPSVPESLNSTDTFRLRTTFEVFGVLCEPVVSDHRKKHSIQLLLHGITYNTQYWDVTWNGFQNYSYVSHSCSRGISSFSYDNLGSGRTVKPANSTQCQLPVMAQVSTSITRYLKNGSISLMLTGKTKNYDKVLAIGHSLGSITFNYAVITEGSRAPFDALILTGLAHTPSLSRPFAAPPAREIDPARWGDLDPGYVSTPTNTIGAAFYGPEGSFSQTLLQLDELTRDTGPIWVANQTAFTSEPAQGFTAPVVELVGSMDALFCPVADGMPCDQEGGLQISDAVLFPDSKNFTMIVLDGGHDVNLGFSAVQAFTIMKQLFQSFVG